MSEATPPSSDLSDSLDISKLQTLLSSGQWSLEVCGEGVSDQRGPDACCEFFVSDRGSLSFCHGLSIYIYKPTDRVTEMDEDGCILEITVTAGHKIVHRWTRAVICSELSGAFALGTDHGCLTGDCDHAKYADCWEFLRDYIRDLCDKGNAAVSQIRELYEKRRPRR